jgi:hypothetical protein
LASGIALPQPGLVFATTGGIHGGGGGGGGSPLDEELPELVDEPELLELPIQSSVHGAPVLLLAPPFDPPLEAIPEEFEAPPLLLLLVFDGEVPHAASAATTTRLQRIVFRMYFTVSFGRFVERTKD